MGFYYKCKFCGTRGEERYMCDCIRKETNRLYEKTVGMSLVRRVMVYHKDTDILIESVEVWKKGDEEMILLRKHEKSIDCFGEYDIELMKHSVEKIINGIKMGGGIDIKDITC